MKTEKTNVHAGKRLYIRMCLRILLLIAAVLFIRFTFGPLFSLLGPFVIAFIFAWMLNPLVTALNKRLGASRKVLSFVAVIAVFICIAGITAALVYRVASEIVDFASNWQTIWESLNNMVTVVAGVFSEISRALPSAADEVISGATSSFLNWANDALSTFATFILNNAGSFASGVASFILALVAFVMAAYFITADYPRIKWLFSKTFKGNTREMAIALKNAAGNAAIGYMRAQLVLSGLVGLIILVSLSIWGQNYAFMIAISTAIIDFIPFFGSGIVLGPWAVICLIYGDYAKAIFLAILGVALFLIRKFAEPKIVGTQTGISPLLSLFSIYAGMKLGGIIGMIFGPIICMAGLSIYRAGLFDATIADIKTAVRGIRKFWDPIS